MRSKLFLLSVSLLVTLTLSEIGLRAIGLTPGVLRHSRWLTEVDTLLVLNGFSVEENGVFTLDTSLTSKISRHPRFYETAFVPPYDSLFVQEIGGPFIDHGIMFDEKIPQNEFWQKVEKIENNGCKTCLDTLIQRHARHPINTHGFYSLDIEKTCHDTRKVLLVGDSFTWGHSAINLTSGFAERLLARGYHIINTGISGSDPEQYRAVIENYVEVAKPDLVIVNFFIGNDVQYFERKVNPNIPPMFHTNAGNIVSIQGGYMFETAQKAYDNVARNTWVPSTSFLNRFLAKTVIGTLVWKALVRLKWIDHQYFISLPNPEIPHCRKELERMKDHCSAHGIPLILSLIPELVDGKLNYRDSVNFVPSALMPQKPHLVPGMYNADDGHFNDEGHQVYADHLQQLIDSTFQVSR